MKTRFILSMFFFVAIVALPCLAVAQDGSGTLFRILTGRNDKIRVRTLATLERDPKRSIAVLDDLIAATKEQVAKADPDRTITASTLRMISLVGSIDKPEAESLLIELLDAEHVGVAMVAADTLGQNKFYGAIEYLKRQVDRPEFHSQYGFRFNIVRALAQMEHPDAIEFLEVLSKKLDGQLKYHLEQILVDVTDSHFHGDETRFAQWERSRQSDVLFQKAGSDSLERLQLGKPRKYYGIDIHAKRMMFIIDHSGSMKDYAAGTTRLGRAKNELLRVVEELPSDAEFAILFFSDGVHQWRNTLVPATDANKKAAAAFINRLTPNGWTNTYEALRKSLDFDGDLEAVFMLTDGRPTKGEIVVPTLIIRDILHRNRFRHLNFNTIGISVSGETEMFLRRLAEESAGEFREAG